MVRTAHLMLRIFAGAELGCAVRTKRVRFDHGYWN